MTSGGPEAYPGWRRNLIAITVAVFIGFTGFTLVMPFLPLYFRDLGLTDVGDIAFWAGISLGITPAVTAVLSPFLGRLADRFGRKIMVTRSLGSFVFVMTALAFVTAPWQVFALRLVQGLFAGYGLLAIAMAADSVPPERMASSIGLVQTAQRLGPAIGPVIGGTIAELVGRRNAFLVSAVFYLAGVLFLIAFYHEVRPAAGKGRSASDSGVLAFRSVLAFENFVLLMAVIFGLMFVDRSLGPILALYLADNGVPSSRVAIISGVMFSLLAVAAAAGNTACAAMLKRRGPRTLIAVCCAVGAVASLVFVLVPSVATWYVAAAALGSALGISMTAAYTAAGSVIPPEARGTGFGILSSASLTAMAVSPMIAGLLARTSIIAVFICDALVLTVIGVIVSRLMAERPARTEMPPTDEV